MNRYETLNKNTVDKIKSFIDTERERRRLQFFYPNIVLRGDVLQILDNDCTVIYYPLENESNNGFHISGVYGKNGEAFNFVYINTHQTLEKQIFTAAHELGHVWKVEDAVCNSEEDKQDEIFKERVVNRFAAELLMPDQIFREQCANVLRQYHERDNRIPLKEFLKLVASLMNFFLVPLKSVIVRFAELEMISEMNVNRFISDEDGNILEIIKHSIDRIIREEGYTELYRPTERKYIKGLVELLNTAERAGVVAPRKIENLRSIFDLNMQMEEKLPEQDIQFESEKNKCAP